MIIMPLVMLLSFGLVVVLIGLTALAYAKKESLSGAYKVVAYLTTICGIVVVVGGITAVIMIKSCGGDKCHEGKSKCHIEMRSDCHGDRSCKKSKSCEYGEKKCKKSCETTCEKDGKKIIKKEIIIEEEGEEVPV